METIIVQEKTQREWKNGKLWNALFWSSSARDGILTYLMRGEFFTFLKELPSLVECGDFGRRRGTAACLRHQPSRVNPS